MSLTPHLLAGRRALVTGGTSGIGAAIARTLAGAGAEVIVAARSALGSAGAETLGGPPRLEPVDVTDAASVAALFQRIGPCDIVIANAGGAESAPFARTDPDLWHRMLSVNLTGVYHTFHAGLGALGARSWGRLIAVASSAGLKGYPYVTAYTAAKHGVVGLVRALALETATSGITVNAVCPGFVETPMTDRSVSTIATRTGRTAEEAKALLAGSSPMRRLVQPEEVAAAVLWLVGPGSGAVTGQAIAVNGGET